MQKFFLGFSAALPLLFLLPPRPINASPGDTDSVRPRIEFNQEISGRFAKLIADLDDSNYPVRDKATRELAKLRDLAIPALRKALEKPVSLEVRVRIEQLLEKRQRFHAYQAKAEAVAREFADHAMKALQILETRHVTPASKQQLIAWSVQGMFQELKEPTLLPGPLPGRNGPFRGR